MRLPSALGRIGWRSTVASAPSPWRIIASIRQCDRVGRYSDASSSNRHAHSCPPTRGFLLWRLSDDAPGAGDIARAGRHPKRPRLPCSAPGEKSSRCHDRTDHGCAHAVVTASSTRGRTVAFMIPGNRAPACRSTVKPSRSCGLHWIGHGPARLRASRRGRTDLCWLSAF
jgi:hypothetical protein